ncbi:MAG: chloride channel protein [Candidatus Dormibacterales bacterium]
MALAIGFGAGFGAFVFRKLIVAFTWLFTGVSDYGVAGRVPSHHLPWLGPWFILITPVLGGLIFGPMIHFFAREARGHGVPEVMLAVAENGGRIRPRVTVVKALASAICMGSGGSVGREGPIVQIGSALASTFGQVVRMPESRLRLLVACGAAGGISATFNAPLAGVFFGLELILREVSAEALVAVLLSSVAADVVGQAAFGRQPFFALPPALLPSAWDYLLCVALGLAAGVVGAGFAKLLYRVEDLCDSVWRGKPEWLRPVAGGVLLGAVLLAIPQLYGVGYPVVQHAAGGGYAIWFLLALMVGKMLSASITIGIGGSGGVFAPSLFIGAMLGTAFGLAVQHLVGPAAAGPVAAYSMVGMGATFAGAARAPLTSISSTLEMTGDFGLVLPVLLAVGLATGVGSSLGRGTIYTTKLLRRGINIERPRPSTLMQQMKVSEAMRPLPSQVAAGRPLEEVVAQLVDSREPANTAQASGGPRVQAVFADETLEQALRQLVMYGHQGLPVLAADGESIVGWIANRDVMRAFAARLGQTIEEAEEGARAAEWASARPDTEARHPRNPLLGYRLVELQISSSAPTKHVRDVTWPASTLLVAVSRNRHSFTAGGETELRPGDRLTLLVPTEHSDEEVSDALDGRVKTPLGERGPIPARKP